MKVIDRAVAGTPTTITLSPIEDLGALVAKLRAAQVQARGTTSGHTVKYYADKFEVRIDCADKEEAKLLIADLYAIDL